MKCPNCGAVYDAPHRFCGGCGTPLEYEIEKKGSHRVPLLILMAMCLVGLSLFFLVPRQSAELPAQSIRWLTVSDGTVSFVQSRYNGDPEVEIPEVVNGQTVTAVDDFAFAYSHDITTVHLPDTVTAIGDYAFDGCESLKAMELPDGVTSIGTFAFSCCPELEAIHIPATVKEIGEDAFYDCESLAFIFFDGTAEEWEALYPRNIDSKPLICTPDGNTFRSE